jgi:GGDEF domain-containing protein
VRSSFEAAGAIVASHAIGATVSIGAAVLREPVTTIDGLIARTAAALHRAKHPVPNRVHIAEKDSADDRTRMIAAVRRARQVGQEQRNTAA